MKYRINKAVVIGAGTMGGAIAAHLANAGVEVTLLDIVPTELTIKEEQAGLTLDDPIVRNRIVKEGLDRTLKSRPASFFSKDFASLVSVGNLEDDFEVIAEADWVIEVIIENLGIKRQLMEQIDVVRSPFSIVSTNTSGIPVASISEGFSESFRQHFLGTHFFNPPRYLKLLEIIPTPDTLPEVMEFVSGFGELRLGKGIVPAKDTPNFIANRLFAGSAAFAIDYIIRNEYSIPEVDAITGPPIGNPKTATFRLFDLIGLDVWQHVGRNLLPAIPHDELATLYMKSELVLNLIDTMVENGWLGNKTKQGFYKQVRTEEGKKEFWSLNLQTMEYEEPSKPRFESIGKVKDEQDLGERLKTLISAEDRAGKLVALEVQRFEAGEVPQLWWNQTGKLIASEKELSQGVEGSQLLRDHPRQLVPGEVEVFERERFHHVVVVDDSKVVGVISDRDLLKRLSPFVGSKFNERKQDENTLNLKAHQVMTRNPVTVSPGDSVQVAVDLILKHSFRSLPVVDASRKPVGIISWKDILRWGSIKGVWQCQEEEPTLFNMADDDDAQQAA